MLSWTFPLVFLATICSAAASLAMRKTLEYKGSVGGYLSFYFLNCFIFSSVLNSAFSIRTISFPMALLGGTTGFLVVVMMVAMGMAMKKGPTGLTLAFQNSGSIMPPLLMALIFKSSFGFHLTLGNIVGMTCVIGGLFWAAKGTSTQRVSKRWLFYALLTFACQALILSVFQWRCLIIAENLPWHRFIPFHCQEKEEIWFMPAMFFSAWILQFAYFLFKEKRTFKKSEFIGGGLGGLANALSTFLLLIATRIATPLENAMLFPVFAVMMIVICNLYGKILYHESIHWLATGCCVLGILIGTLL